MPPTWEDQRAYATAVGAKGLYECVEAFNVAVVPCQVRPRVFWFLWRPRRHRYFEHVVMTLTHTQFDRCDDCGHCKLESGY
jgi:hypothetical protein